LRLRKLVSRLHVPEADRGRCALAKALSSGIVPGVDRPVGGPARLPAAALGQLLAMPLFLGISGWWRFASERWMGGRRVLLPTRDTALSALFMAVVIGTTTLNFTFAGAVLLGDVNSYRLSIMGMLSLCAYLAITRHRARSR
jgi:hypothetical protein